MRRRQQAKYLLIAGRKRVGAARNETKGPTSKVGFFVALYQISHQDYAL
jgi:hypothetical protein